jgi:GNAT superfamily N-acetyltransferase
MNKLSVRHLNFKTTRYRLENEDGTLLSSLEIDREYMTKTRRECLGFPIEDSVYYLCDFVTTREQKRKGYGRELLNRIKEETKGQFIYLIVHSAYEDIFPDDKLVEFYKSVGFKVHEQKYEYKYYTWMVLDNR